MNIGGQGRSPAVPGSFEPIEESLKERLAAIRCSEHDLPVEAKLLVADDGAVHVIPVGCCDQVERLAYTALCAAATMTPPALPEVEEARLRVSR
jgi:hypothetical protein